MRHAPYYIYRPSGISGIYILTGFLVSKETVLLRRWRVKRKFGFMKQVDKGWITTKKDLESWRFVSPSSERMIKPNFFFFALTWLSEKKRHWVGQFSTRLPLSVSSLFCLFQKCTNDMSWVRKSRTGEATNWPGKIKNFMRYRGG